MGDILCIPESDKYLEQQVTKVCCHRDELFHCVVKNIHISVVLDKRVRLSKNRSKKLQIQLLH